MYGWFEPGGGVNKYFQDTKMIDVLLRTSSFSNNIVIGNSYVGGEGEVPGTAGLYVYKNNVGIKKVPNPLYSLDVYGDTRLEKVFIGDSFVMNSNAISNSNILIDKQGLIQNTLLITNNIKSFVANITTTVTKVNFIPGSTQLLKVTFQFVNTLDKITARSVLKINGIVFAVSRIVNAYTFELKHALDNNPILTYPFAADDILTFDVFDDYSFNSEDEHIIVLFNIVPGTIVRTSSKVTMNITLLDVQQITNLVAGRFYSLTFSYALDTLLLLESVTIINNTTVSVRLGTIDDTAFPVTFTESDSSLQLVMLDSLYPPPTEDLNVTGGTYTEGNDNKLWLKGTRLDQYINVAGQASKSILKITFNDYLSFDVISIYNDNSGKVLANLSAFNTSYTYMFSSRGSLKYQLVGYPIKLTLTGSALSENGLVTIYTYTFADPLFVASQLALYKGSKIYFSGSNTICNLIDIDLIEDTIKLDVFFADANNGVFKYIIPFKQSYVAQLGTVNCYIPNSLAIGTKIATDRLTVNGGISMSGSLTMTNDTTNKYTQSFIGNVLNMNDTVLIEKKAGVTINTSTTVFGSVTAENGFLHFSDRKIKKNITPSRAKSDLELIKKINVYNFDMKNGDSHNKGFIAQEVEKVLPHIVHTSVGYLPSICEFGRVSGSSDIINIKLEEKVLEDIRPGTRLQIEVDGSSMDVKVLRVRIKKGQMFIKVSKRFCIGQCVYVFGPYTNCKSVDKDYLLMALFNAVKAIERKYKNLEKKLMK